MQLEKVDYDLNVKAFRRGTSLFIPCLDCELVRAELVAYFKRFRIKVVTKVAIAEGIRGCRVWRL